MDAESASTDKPRLRPTRFFLRGLATSLPPILTLVILLWVARGVNTYIVYPASATVRYVIAKFIDDSLPPDSTGLVELPNAPPLEYVGRNYLVTDDLKVQFDHMLKWRRPPRAPAQDRPDSSEDRTLQKEASEAFTDDSDELTATLTGPELLDVMQVEEQYRAEWLEERAYRPGVRRYEDPEVYVPLDRAVPFHVYANVARRLPPAEWPTTATGVYMDYAAQLYFGSQFLLSAAAVSLIVVLLYFLGRFVNARIGGWIVNKVETDLLGRLPIIRNVYGSAKQVTDFLFSENQVEYRRVVAIEYPRRGIWSLGFVTGESMLDITAAVGEPCVSVLIPSSPMPVTGYTMCLPRSAVLDLNISVDQACQFCISCGVLVPPNQRVTPELLRRELTKRLAERMRESGTNRRPIPALGSGNTAGSVFAPESPPAPESDDRPESESP